MSESKSEPGGLLAALVPQSVLIQPEVALTRGIAWLLSLPGAGGALHSLISESGIDPEPLGIWRTEVRGEDLGRTDLEYYRDGEDAPLVVVEAKIGHTLTQDQILAYRHRIKGASGLLAILVPAGRRSAATRVAEAVNERLAVSELRDGVQVAVWTYDQVASALSVAMPDSGDLAQFRGLLAAHRALDIEPLELGNLLENDGSRRDDVWRVVDAASFGLFDVRLPYSSDASLEKRRFVSLAPYEVGLAVGVGRLPRDPSIDGRQWAWVRISNSGPFSRVAQGVLEDLRPGEVSIDQGAMWLPLNIPTGVMGGEMIPAVREEITAIADEIRRAIAAVAIDLESLPAEIAKHAKPVQGVEGIAASDLLDSSESRLDDIRLLLTQAAKVFSKNRYPLVADVDYLQTRWVPLDGYGGGTHVSTCIGRAERTNGGPQPWAWLRIHEVTPGSAVAIRTLERLNPEGFVRDPHGAAVPLHIPADAAGPLALQEICTQMNNVMVAIRQALSAEVAGGAS